MNYGKIIVLILQIKKIKVKYIDIKALKQEKDTIDTNK